MLVIHKYIINQLSISQSLKLLSLEVSLLFAQATEARFIFCRFNCADVDQSFHSKLMHDVLLHFGRSFPSAAGFCGESEKK